MKALWGGARTKDSCVVADIWWESLYIVILVVSLTDIFAITSVEMWNPFLSLINWKRFPVLRTFHTTWHVMTNGYNRESYTVSIVSIAPIRGRLWTYDELSHWLQHRNRHKPGQYFPFAFPVIYNTYKNRDITWIRPLCLCSYSYPSKNFTHSAIAVKEKKKITI